jgi:hypothetical protein
MRKFTFHICLHAEIQISGKVNYAALCKRNPALLDNTRDSDSEIKMSHLF